MRRDKKLMVFCFLAVSMGLSFAGCGKKQDSSVATPTTQTVSEEISGTTEEVVENSTEEVKTQVADYELTLSGNNSWKNGDLTCTQFDGLIKNHSKETGSDWKITLTVPKDAKIENGWNGDYKISGTTLTITPADYNREIASDGGEVSFGFIMDTKDSYKAEEGFLSIGGKEYALNDTAQVDSDSETTKEKSSEETTTEDKKEVAKKDTTGTPVDNHGALSVKGTDIVDCNGKVFQLKGVSTHGIGWFPDYVQEDTFASLSEYGVNAIRLAMYTAEGEGYCTGGDKAKLESLVDQGVEACTNLGLYVIVDWHVLQDLDPNVHKEEAKKFFDMVSKKYADHDNVIYEICNEPNGGTSWESVKTYAEEIIPVIRKNDKNALIIVGTPNWSQDVDVASDNPIKGQNNILYAVHFYAATHKDNIRNKVETARKNGLCIIVSECSICEASGNGIVDYDEADLWMKLINDNHMSVFCWNLSNKDEKSSLLKSSVTKTSGFSMDDFSETGKWFMEQYRK